MKLNKGWMAAALAALAALLLIRTFQSAPEPVNTPPPQDAAALQRVQRLEQELTRTRAALARLAAQQAPAVPAAGASTPAQASAAAPSSGSLSVEPSNEQGEPSPERLQAQAAEQQRFQEQQTRVATEFEHETRDPGWSNDTQKSIQNALASNDLTRTAVEKIDCRTSRCRVEFQDTPQLASLLPVLASDIAPSLSIMKVQRSNEANGRKLVLYLAR